MVVMKASTEELVAGDDLSHGSEPPYMDRSARMTASLYYIR